MMVTMMRIIVRVMQNLHLFGNFYKLLLAVLMNRMRPCFEKKKKTLAFSRFM